MPGRGRSNPLALAVLACLYERPMHPYEVSQTLRFRAKDQSIRLNFGSLYSVVESLEKRGFIVPTETVREGKRPERTIYAITDAGKRELIDWLSELVSTPVKEYLSFEAALVVAARPATRGRGRLLSDRCVALEVRLAQSRGRARTPRPCTCRGSSCSRTSTGSGSWKPSSASARGCSRRSPTGRSKASRTGPPSTRPRPAPPSGGVSTEEKDT